MACFTIGIAGGTGAGKTRFAGQLAERFGDRAVVIPYDAYYRDLSDLPEAERARVNFDSPDALETDLLVQHLDALKRGEPVRVPVYDFATHTRTSERDVSPAPVVIVEGILLLNEPAVCNRLDLKVFVEASADERILRRLARDVDERGRSVASVMDQYRTTVRPMHDRFVEPSRAQADLVVNGEGETERAVDVVVAHVDASAGQSS